MDKLLMYFFFSFLPLWMELKDIFYTTGEEVWNGYCSFGLPEHKEELHVVTYTATNPNRPSLGRVLLPQRQLKYIYSTTR